MKQDPFAEHYFLLNKRGVWQACCKHCEWKGQQRSEVDPFPSLTYMLEGMEGMVWQHLYQTHHIADHLFAVRKRNKAAWAEQQPRRRARRPRR